MTYQYKQGRNTEETQILFEIGMVLLNGNQFFFVFLQSHRIVQFVSNSKNLFIDP